MKTLPNGLAFPGLSEDWSTESGLTKRELISKDAMQGILSNPNWGNTITDDWEEFRDRTAEAAVEMADALINQLNKEE